MTRYGKAFTPQSTLDWENRIADAWREQWGGFQFDGMVEIWCYFATKRHTVKDLDNLEKSVWDGLEKGGAFAKNDSQIYASHASKVPPVDGEYVVVVMRDLDDYPYTQH